MVDQVVCRGVPVVPLKANFPRHLGTTPPSRPFPATMQPICQSLIFDFIFITGLSTDHSIFVADVLI